MDRTRIMLATYVDLDPIPGAFHTADSARNAVGGLLKQQLGHYSPVVGVISYGRQFYNMKFDHNNRNWSDQKELNLLFVKGAMNHAQDLLIARGYIFLNEVYDVLGFPKTREGQLVGWVEGPISWDWNPLEGEENLRVSFYTEGCIIDKAFEEDKTFEYIEPKHEDETEEEE